MRRPPPRSTRTYTLLPYTTLCRSMLPLHGFLRCPKCTRMLSGSASKGCGGYYYYYHCSASCRVRFRAVDVNGLFEKEIGHFTVREGLEYIYREIGRAHV